MRLSNKLNGVPETAGAAIGGWTRQRRKKDDKVRLIVFLFAVESSDLISESYLDGIGGVGTGFEYQNNQGSSVKEVP